MNEDQQNKCVAFLLAIAMEGQIDKVDIQKKAKAFLATLPEEVIAKAAGTSVEF